MRFPLSRERRAVLLINSKKLKQVREKLNLSERLAQLPARRQAGIGHLIIEFYAFTIPLLFCNSIYPAQITVLLIFLIKPLL